MENSTMPELFQFFNVMNNWATITNKDVSSASISFLTAWNCSPNNIQLYSITLINLWNGSFTLMKY